ncbi:MAG: BatA domain-containing protein [Bacteroidetes bacterium]|nr:BatA domain-containing protein [Bacteroidota bacterium]
MTFLNPLVLIGLIAAGIPLLIHLLQLKKLRRVDFSSIRFLKEIQHASVKRVKLRDYLLLVLRTLAIASLVLAFSRPAVKGFLGAGSKTSAVVIADNSPSTTARNEYGEIASQIRTVSSALLNNLHDGDDAGVIFLSSARDTGAVVSSLDPKSLSNVVLRSEPSNVSESYDEAIDEALAKLRTSGYVDREIYLVGDMQRGEFGKAVPTDIPPNTRIFFVRTDESPNDNLSVSGVKLLNPVVEINAPSEVEATIVNNGGADKSGVVVGLFIDGKKVAQSVINMGAGVSRPVKLAFSVSSGGFHEGSVRIDDNSIQRDNTFYFSFFAIRKLNVIVVSCASQPSDFVLSAAQAVTDTSTVIDTRVVTSGNFVYMNLAGVDVVVVETYPRGAPGSGMSDRFDTKLEQFVRGGGGVILFAPKPDELGAYIPLVEGLKIGSVKGLWTGSGNAFQSIDHIDASDDFFSGIFSTAQGAENIKRNLVTRIYRGVEIEANPFAHVLMSTSAGPFLIGREAGGGFAFAMASGPDTASSNFPLSPFFPVVIQRALFYSAAVNRRPIQLYAGEDAMFHFADGGIKSAVLISPSGNRSEIVPEFVGGTARFTFHRTGWLGTYTLVGRDTLTEVSVNINPRESNLAQESDSGIKAFAEKIGFSSGNVYVVKGGRNTVQAISRLRRGEDLSSLFAGAALLFLIGEIFVSRMKTVS